MRLGATLALPVLALMQGCSILHHGGVGADVFPVGYEAVCMRQLASARAGIEQCGSPLRRTQAVEVYLHKGTKKISGMWCWEWMDGYYVAGMTHGGRKIEVGCSPQGKEVNSGVLLHEFGHYWLETNYGDYSHNAKYDAVFRWSALKAITVTARSRKGNEYGTIDTPEEIAVEEQPAEAGKE